MNTIEYTYRLERKPAGGMLCDYRAIETSANRGLIEGLYVAYTNGLHAEGFDYRVTEQRTETSERVVPQTIQQAVAVRTVDDVVTAMLAAGVSPDWADAYRTVMADAVASTVPACGICAAGGDCDEEG